MNNHIDKAAKAMSNLNAWGAVVAIIEGGCLSGERPQSAASKVINICKKEMQKELSVFEDEKRKAKDT